MQLTTDHSIRSGQMIQSKRSVCWWGCLGYYISFFHTHSVKLTFFTHPFLTCMIRFSDHRSALYRSKIASQILCTDKNSKRNHNRETQENPDNDNDESAREASDEAPTRKAHEKPEDDHEPASTRRQARFRKCVRQNRTSSP